MQYHHINQIKESVHETDAYSLGEPKPGGVYCASIKGVGSKGPEVDVGCGLCTIVKSTHPFFSEQSNAILDELVSGKHNGDSINVLVLGEYCDGIRAVATDLGEGMYRLGKPKLTVEEAHHVVKSDNVFWGQCTSRKVDVFSGVYFWKSPAAITYGLDNQLMRGYVEPVDFRFSDGSTDTWSPSSIEDAYRSQKERSLTSALVNGSREYGFRQLLPGDNMLLRLKGDNGKGTHFFEPVINLTDSDDAFDKYGNQMITRVFSPEGFVRMMDFQSGDLVMDLPVLHSYDDCGVGYIYDYSVFFSEGGTFKPVIVEGGKSDVTKIIKKSRIVLTGDFLIAQRSD
jgi:hypothetical protein